MSVLVAALLLIGSLLLLAAVHLRRRSGLPWRRVVYQDTGGRRPEHPLVSQRFGLVGQPDYLIEDRGRLVPVEVKPGRRADKPYKSDLMQLAAYCLLVEEHTGTSPEYGLLRYQSHTFRIEWTSQLRAELLALLEEMRTDLGPTEVHRSHDDAARCHGCGFASRCSEALQ